MHHYCLMASIALICVACGPRDFDSETSIYGGRPALENSRMDAVALMDDEGVFCSATAVSPTLVLTAAHCALDKLAGDIRVYVGSGEAGGMMPRSAQLAVASLAVNPLYEVTDPERGHDAAYLVLQEPISLPPEAFTPILTNPIEAKELLRGGVDSYLVGFGWNKKNVLGVKTEVKAKVRKLFDSEVSLGGSGRDACQGDSGGPAYGQLQSGAWRVYGITSRGSDCGSGGIWGLMSANICWAQIASSVTDLSLPPGTCPEIKGQEKTSR